MEIEIGGSYWEVIKNYRDAFDMDEFFEKYTSYFNNYDYIVGDISYGKLRLKGFCDKGSRLYNKMNDYAKIEKYLKENCAYDCKHFIIKKKNV